MACDILELSIQRQYLTKPVGTVALLGEEDKIGSNWFRSPILSDLALL